MVRKTNRSGMRWNKREATRLVSAYNAGKTYDEIASLGTFRGRRTKKAIRRFAEKNIV